MRCSLFGLFLSAGTFALGQAGPAAPLTPLGDETPSLPTRSPWTSLNREFGKMTPQQWNGLSSLQSRSVFLPAPAAPRVPLGDAQIDPQMIVHPTARDLGVQPAGTLVAQNLYPGLQYLPIEAEGCGPKGGPLSTTWRELKVEPISIAWPKFKMEPTANSATSLSSPKR